MISALPPIFAGLEPDDQAQARNMLQPIRFEPGDMVMVQGEEDTSLAFITSGTAEILLDEVKAGVATAREMLGEMELFTGLPRLGSIRAANTLDLLVLGPEDYLELCESGNPLVYRLEQAALRRTGDRLRFMNEAIARLSEGEPFRLKPKGKGILGRLNPFGGGNPDLDVTDVLTSSELFSWAQASVLDELASDFGTAAFRKDNRICSQGEPGDRMYIVASGEVDVVLQIAEDRAERIATLGPGMAFGDSAIMHACPRTATVVANGDVSCLVMEREKFLAVTESYAVASSVFRQGLIRNLVGQIAQADKRFVFLSSTQVDSQEMYKGTPVSTMWRD